MAKKEASQPEFPPEVVQHAVAIPMVPAPPASATTRAEQQVYLPGTMGAHLEIQMNATESELYHRIHEALVRARVHLKNGRVVERRGDALRWMFEQIEAAEAKRGKKAPAKTPEKERASG